MASVLAIGLPGAAAQNAVTVEAFAASEPVYRGVSEAAGRPTVGASLEWGVSSDFFVAATAQASATPAVQQREQQLMFVGGWQKAWTDQVSLGLSLSHRAFPGSTKNWDSTELHAAIGLGRVGTIEVSYSPNYYDHETRAVAFALRANRELNRRFFVSAEAGAVEMSSERWPDYQYATLGLGLRQQQFVIEARSSFATNEGDNLFGEPLDAPRLVLQTSYLFR
ncbi:MAG: TorF family putative porin [Gammaproteobacteria bacterium]